MTVTLKKQPLNTRKVKNSFLNEDITISKSKLSIFRKNSNGLDNRELAISIISSDSPVSEFEKLRKKWAIPKLPARFWEHTIQYNITGELPEQLFDVNMDYLTNKKTGIIFLDENMIETFSKIEKLVKLLNYTNSDSLDAYINLEFPAS